MARGGRSGGGKGEGAFAPYLEVLTKKKKKRKKARQSEMIFFYKDEMIFFSNYKLSPFTQVDQNLTGVYPGYRLLPIA